MSGGHLTLHAVSYNVNSPFEATNGSSARFIVDLSDRTKSKIINMPGISENFMSPHYDDQLIPWYNFEMRPLMINREQVVQNQRYYTKLLPLN